MLMTFLPGAHYKTSNDMDIDLLHSLAQNAEDAPTILQFPPIVEDRVLVCDADHLAYKACNLEESFAENAQRLNELVTVWRMLAGAVCIELHVTLGTKGGREDIATVWPYQGNRKPDPEKDERVRDLRIHMASMHSFKAIGMPQHEQEADDSCCQAMWEDRDVGICVYLSPDKDSWMVGGKHLNAKTLEIVEYPWGYGRTDTYVNGKGSRKLEGKGTSFFWHQMLMGDSVDNIPGLPYINKDMWIKYAPTEAIRNVQRKLLSGRMPSGRSMNAKQKIKAVEQYDKIYNDAVPAKKVGAMMAHKILANCLNDRMAYNRVCEVYEHTYDYGDSYKMMLEQGRLLWMRREVDQDVETWWQEILSR